MISRRASFPLFGIVTSTMLFASCGEKKATEEVENASPPQTSLAGSDVTLAETRGFFNPKKDEEWTYRVTREVPVTSRLSDQEALRIVAKHDSHYELAFERKRICGGPVFVDDFDSELIVINIYEDNELAELEYYEVTSEGLFGRGWSDQLDEAPIISSSAIPIAVPGMTGGAMWRTAAQESAKQYKFRVIERSQLTLPSGTFNVAQIQILAGNAMSSVKRTLWFAENVGIVKEVSTYYDATSIRIRETSELIAWQLPEGEQQAQTETEKEFAAEAASTGTDESPEESKEEL